MTQKEREIFDDWFESQICKCKNCKQLKKVHKQEETEADTFICMEKLSIMPTELIDSYSCCEFVWKTEE